MIPRCNFKGNDGVSVIKLIDAYSAWQQCSGFVPRHFDLVKYESHCTPSLRLRNARALEQLRRSGSQPPNARTLESTYRSKRATRSEQLQRTMAW